MFRKRKNKFKKIKPQNFVYTRVKKRKKRIILTILYILLGVVFAFGLLYFLFFSEYFNIKNISFSGEKTIKEYEEQAGEEKAKADWIYGNYRLVEKALQLFKQGKKKELEEIGARIVNGKIVFEV